MLLKKLPFWIILAFALLELTLLSHPPTPVFDEKFYISTPPTLANGHPPLGRAMIWASINLLGDNPFAWRIPTLLASLATLILIYQIGQRHFGRKVALFAFLLLSLDTLWLTISKLGMLDVFVTLFALSSFYFLLDFTSAKTRPKSWAPLFLSSFFLGLSLSVKWSAILLLPLFSLIVLARSKNLIFTFCFLIFTFLPYLLSHLPILLSSGFSGFIGHNLANLAITSGIQLKPEFTNAYPPFWFLAPFLFPLPIYKEGNALMLFFFNPLSGWFFLVSLFFLIKDFLKKRFPKPLIFNFSFLIFNFAFLYLPWLLASRDAFLNHMVPLLPFVYLIQGLFLAKLTRTKMGRFLAAVYLYLIFAVTLIAFPFLFAIPVDLKAWVSGVVLLAALPVFFLAFPKKVWSVVKIKDQISKISAKGGSASGGKITDQK